MSTSEIRLPAPGAAAPPTGVLRRVRAALPQGNSLPAAEWARRHRFLLTLYEDWLIFLLAAGYVALHHGVMGAIDPGSVYDHADAVAHPWKWALIHSGFIAAAGAGALVAWRFNEDVREERRRAHERAV